jgi:hypothetical protein
MWKVSTLGVLLTFAAIPAQGQELIFGANVGGRWDSNVENVPDGPSDFSARLGPEVRLRTTEGDLLYDIHYVPTYQLYSRFASLDDWDQLLSAIASYRISGTTSINVSNNFEYVPTTTSFLQQLASPTGVPLGGQVVNVVGRETVLVNNANVGLHHSWSERWISDVTFSNFYYDPRVQNSVSSSNTTGSGNLAYIVTPTDSIGSALSATVQQFGGNNFQNSTTSYFYNVSGIWNHDFSPTWALKMQAGPTYVSNGSVSTPSAAQITQFPTFAVPGFGALPFLINFATCGRLPSGQSALQLCAPPSLGGLPVTPDVTQPSRTNFTAVVPLTGASAGSQSSITYFANLSMQKRWETVTAILSYTRSAGTSGLFQTSTVVDTFSGNVVWNVSPLWTVSLTALWADTSSSSNDTVGFFQLVSPLNYQVRGQATAFNTPQITAISAQQQKISTNIYATLLQLRVDYRVTKRLSAFANVFFYNQNATQNQALVNLSNLNYDATRIDLGFHYEFDPIHL